MAENFEVIGHTKVHINTKAIGNDKNGQDDARSGKHGCATD